MRTKDIGIFAAAARRSAEGDGSRGEAGGEPAEARHDGGVLSSGGARADVERGASTTGRSGAVRKVSSCATQSTDGLCWRSQGCPSTASAEEARGVTRKRMECWVPQGKVTGRVVYW